MLYALFFAVSMNCAPLDEGCNSPDAIYLQYLIEEFERKNLIGKPGCPIEPGTYWNLECA